MRRATYEPQGEAALRAWRSVGGVVVADRVDDDGGWDFGHELAEGRVAGAEEVDAHLDDVYPHGCLVQVAAWSASGEEPGRRDLRRGRQVGTVGGEITDEGAEGFGDLRGGVAEIDAGRGVCRDVDVGPALGFVSGSAK